MYAPWGPTRQLLDLYMHGEVYTLQGQEVTGTSSLAGLAWISGADETFRCWMLLISWVFAPWSNSSPRTSKHSIDLSLSLPVSPHSCTLPCGFLVRPVLAGDAPCSAVQMTALVRGQSPMPQAVSQNVLLSHVVFYWWLQSWLWCTGFSQHFTAMECDRGQSASVCLCSSSEHCLTQTFAPLFLASSRGCGVTLGAPFPREAERSPHTSLLAVPGITEIWAPGLQGESSPSEG